MMARRLIVKVRPPRRRTAAQPRIPFPDVAVLLGDPSLPDSVKLDGEFNALDFQTVDRLKTALAGLPGYRFTYLDRHADLAERLRRQPPAFVLNLMAEMAGWSYADLLRRILESAQERVLFERESHEAQRRAAGG